MANPQQEPPTFKSKLKAATFLVVLALLPFLALTVLWRDRCHKTALQTVASPSGEMRAEQIIADCGPRMRVASEVRLERLKDGNPIDDATVLVIPSREKLNIRWLDAQTLTIQLPGSQSQVVKYRREWAGVKVSLIGDVVSSAPKGIETL